MFDFIKSRKTPETPKEEVTVIEGDGSEITVNETEHTVDGRVVKERHVTVSRGHGGPQPVTPTPPSK